MTPNLPAIVVGLLILVALVLLIRFFFRRKPNKTDTHYVDFWGRPRRRIHYNDTGKVVKQVHTFNWRGQPVKKTYVEKRCFACGAKVTKVKNGVYQCRCGNRFR